MATTVVNPNKTPIPTPSFEPPFGESMSIYSQIKSMASVSTTTTTLTNPVTPTTPQPTVSIPPTTQAVPNTPIHPSTFPVRDPKTRLWHLERLSPQTKPSSLVEYFKNTLSVSSLDEIYDHLWSAGLPGLIHPLHEQLGKGRSIIVSDKADYHLIKIDETRIYIKPLEALLLDHSTWKNCLCENPELFRAAAGFLRSWLWLLCSESDYYVAIEHHLIPSYVTWEMWTKFSASVYDHLIAFETTTYKRPEFSPRYHFGELRVGRINNIYRWQMGVKKLHATKIIRGYNYMYTTYSSFIQRNTAWLLAVVVYAGLVLSAMQVGLGTLELGQNDAFNQASYGFAVFSILGPLIILAGVGIVVLVLVLFNTRYAWSKWKKAKVRSKIVTSGS